MDRRGFTLAELQVAMLILAIILTYTIPKVLASQQVSYRKTIFKELYGIFSGVFYEGHLRNQNSISSDSWGTYMQGKVNAIKVCDDANADGCWTHAAPATGEGELSKPGFVMHTGATVAGLGGDTFLVDWNGDKSPNLEGDDQIVFWVCYQASGSCDGTLRAGKIGVDAANYPSSNTLYLEIFQ